MRNESDVQRLREVLHKEQATMQELPQFQAIELAHIDLLSTIKKS